MEEEPEFTIEELRQFRDELVEEGRLVRVWDYDPKSGQWCWFYVHRDFIGEYRPHSELSAPEVR